MSEVSERDFELDKAVSSAIGLTMKREHWGGRQAVLTGRDQAWLVDPAGIAWTSQRSFLLEDFETRGPFFSLIPPFSSDGKDGRHYAICLLEHMQSAAFQDIPGDLVLRPSYPGPKRWQCGWVSHYTGYDNDPQEEVECSGYGETIPEAVCRALVLAVSRQDQLRKEREEKRAADLERLERLERQQYERLKEKYEPKAVTMTLICPPRPVPHASTAGEGGEGE